MRNLQKQSCYHDRGTKWTTTHSARSSNGWGILSETSKFSFNTSPAIAPPPFLAPASSLQAQKWQTPGFQNLYCASQMTGTPFALSESILGTKAHIGKSTEVPNSLSAPVDLSLPGSDAADHALDGSDDAGWVLCLQRRHRHSSGAPRRRFREALRLIVQCLSKYAHYAEANNAYLHGNSRAPVN